MKIENLSHKELRTQLSYIHDLIYVTEIVSLRNEYVKQYKEIEGELKKRESEIGITYTSKLFNNKEICEQHGFDYDKIKMGVTEKQKDMKTIKVIFKIIGIGVLIIIALAILTTFIAGIITGLTQ